MAAADAHAKRLLLAGTSHHAVALNKLLHMPTVRAKEAAERPDGVAYGAALRHLFALEDVA